MSLGPVMLDIEGTALDAAEILRNKYKFRGGGNTNTNMDTDQNKNINKNKDKIDNGINFTI